MLIKGLLKEGAPRPHTSVITFSHSGPSHLHCQVPVFGWLWQYCLPSLLNSFWLLAPTVRHASQIGRAHV